MEEFHRRLPGLYLSRWKAFVFVWGHRNSQKMRHLQPLWGRSCIYKDQDTYCAFLDNVSRWRTWLLHRTPHADWQFLTDIWDIFAQIPAVGEFIHDSVDSGIMYLPTGHIWAQAVANLLAVLAQWAQTQTVWEGLLLYHWRTPWWIDRLKKFKPP